MSDKFKEIIKAIKDWCLGKFQKAGDYVTNSELQKYSLITETGSEISISMDPTNYIMKLSLKNKNGKILSEKTIDFPLESMVVDAYYESGIITFTLQNGTSFQVDVPAIVNGLVDEEFTIAGIDMKDNITASELRTALSINNVDNVSTNNQKPTFVQATDRGNIESGETLSVILGKAKRFFSDLKTVAFSGRYEDLEESPEKLPNPSSLTFTGSVSRTYDGSSPVSIQIPNVYMTQSDKNKLDKFSDAEKYALKTDLSALYKYKGSLYDESMLPEDAETGDVYNLVTSAIYGNGANVAWDGANWDSLGAAVNLSGYVEKEELEEIGSQEIEDIWNTVFNG